MRLQFKDETYEYIVGEDYNAVAPYYYSEKLEKTGSLSYEASPLGSVGNRTIELELFGVKCEVSVTVKENLMETITLRESDDKFLTITVYNSDATSYEMKILDFIQFWEMNNGWYYAEILTDKGQFEARIFNDEKSFMIALVNPYDGTLIKSNRLVKSDWFDIVKIMRRFGVYYLYTTNDFISKYDGVLTADNIDAIIKIAYYEYGESIQAINENEEYKIFAGDDIVRLVMKVFELDSVDISLSKNFNSVDNTYKFSEGLFDDGERYRVYADKINYCNGIWSFEISFGTLNFSSEREKWKIKLNDEYKLLSFSMNEDKLCPITSTKYAINNGFIDGVIVETTVDDLLSNITGGEYCKVYKDTKEVSGNTVVGTGMVVKLVDGETIKSSYVVVVKGDIDGNGEIDSTDYLMIKSMFLRKISLKDEGVLAADTDGNGKINSADYLRMKQYCLGRFAF